MTLKQLRYITVVADIGNITEAAKKLFIAQPSLTASIQELEKESNKDMVCVQLGQDYNSSSYADHGYLFLMIDMSDENSPFIKVRTWQPQPDPKFGYYNADYMNNDSIKYC